MYSLEREPTMRHADGRAVKVSNIPSTDYIRSKYLTVSDGEERSRRKRTLPL